MPTLFNNKSNKDLERDSYREAGDKSVVAVKIEQQSSLFVIEDDSKLPVSRYIGKTYNQGALTSDPVWQVSRVIYAGTEIVEEYANNGAFDQVFDDRFLLFTYKSALSIYFNGIDQYLDFSDSSGSFEIERTDQFSFGMWIKPGEVTGVKRLICNRSADIAGNKGFDVFLSDDTVNLFIGENSSGIWVSAGSLLHNEWQHIIVTYDGTQLASGINIYIDGILQAPTVNSDNISLDIAHTGPWFIGRNTAGSSYYHGYIDEVSMFMNKSLTQLEVDELYNNGTPHDLSSLAGITTWAPFGEGDTFPIVNDVVSGLSAVMVAMTSESFAKEVKI